MTDFIIEVLHEEVLEGVSLLEITGGVGGSCADQLYCNVNCDDYCGENCDNNCDHNCSGNFSCGRFCGSNCSFNCDYNHLIGV